jgi:hypothetical protein
MACRPYSKGLISDHLIVKPPGNGYYRCGDLARIPRLRGLARMRLRAVSVLFGPCVEHEGVIDSLF